MAETKPAFGYLIHTEPLPLGDQAKVTDAKEAATLKPADSSAALNNDVSMEDRSSYLAQERSPGANNKNDVLPSLELVDGESGQKEDQNAASDLSTLEPEDREVIARSVGLNPETASNSDIEEALNREHLDTMATSVGLGPGESKADVEKALEQDWMNEQRRVLGLGKDASLEEINKAWLKEGAQSLGLSPDATEAEVKKACLSREAEISQMPPVEQKAYRQQQFKNSVENGTAIVECEE